MSNARAALFALEAGSKEYQEKHIHNIQKQIDELDDEHVDAAIQYLVHETYIPKHPYVTQVLEHYHVEVMTPLMDD